MIDIKEIGKESEDILFEYMQRYFEEMSLYYEYEKDDKGRYVYKYLPRYFTEDSRHACFIYEDECVVGFVLVNKYAFTNEIVDNCIAEFYIFPEFRSKGYGMQAVDCLLALMPGKWQLKYSLDNKPGVRFWKKVKEKYEGTETDLEDNEVAMTLCYKR